jgi:hypothetical protein
MTSHPNWQESLNPQLLQRLVRPLVQPGVISSKMAQSIVQRSQRFANRLPMLKIAYRGYATSNSNVEPVPIVYAQPQPVLANSVATNLESNSQPLVSGDSRASQSEESRSSSQLIVVQAKFDSPSSPASMPVNRSKKLTDSTDIQPPQAENVPFIAYGSPPTNVPSESLPIVPVQNLISNTGSNARIASNVSPIDRTQIDTREPAIIQAKFDSENTEIASQNLAEFPNINLIDTPNSLPTIPLIQPDSQYRVSPSNSTASLDRIQLENIRADGTNLLANSEDLTPQPPSLLGKGELESPFPKGKRELESPSPLRGGVGEGSRLIDRQEIPIVYLHSKPAEEVNSQMSDSTTNAIAAIPLSTISSKDRSQLLPKVFAIPGTLNPSPELQEPLVFTQPQSEAKSAAQSDESSYLSHPELGESDRQMSNSQVSNSQVFNLNLQNSNKPENHSNQPVNIDALADKIERKLMRKLIVENERRGRRSWS